MEENLVPIRHTKKSAEQLAAKSAFEALSAENKT
jgi:hypothetical protein